MSADVSDRDLTDDEKGRLAKWMNNEDPGDYWDSDDVAFNATKLAENAASALEIFGGDGPDDVSIPEEIFEMAQDVCDDWETRNEPVKDSLNRGGRQSQLTVAHVAEGLAAHQRGDFTLSAKLLRR